MTPPRPQGHADKKEGWPALSTVGDLTQILCTMIWIVSGHHAAVNFSQYGFAGYVLNRPAVCTKRIPQRDTPGYKVRNPATSGWAVYIMG
jgi:lipoxygenase